MANDKPKAKTTLQILAGTEGGNGLMLLQDFDNTVQAAVMATMQSGKKSSVTLTLTVEPTKFHAGRALAFAGAVKATLPKKPGNPSHYFPDEDGKVYDDDIQRFNGDVDRSGENIFPINKGAEA